MRISAFITCLGALALVAGTCAEAQRSPSSSLGVGANPPLAPAPIPPRAVQPPYVAPTAVPSRVGAPATAANASPSGDAATDQTYILGASDVIEISVLGRSEYTTRARISEDGTIQLQYLGVMNVASRTAAQLSEQIGNALEKGGYFANPVVRVDVVSYASRYVTVLGSFATPGLVPVDRAYRLSEIVARVGGVREGGADFIILRPKSGEERHIKISTLATGAASDDPFVSPGDKIYSPPAELIYVTGQVKGPGAFPIIQDMTVRMALSRAGGLSDSGSDRKVSITRKGSKVGRVDLDAKIEAGDIILVGERLF